MKIIFSFYIILITYFKKYSNIFFLLLFSTITIQVSATTYYVNDGFTTGDIYCTAVGASGNTGLTPGSPKQTIAQIIALSPAAGSVIYVDAGTYAESGINFSGKTLIIYGAGTSNTIFSNGNLNAVFATNPGSAYTLTMNDLSIKNYSSESNGLGILFTITSSSNLTLNNVIISGCDKKTASSSGRVPILISGTANLTVTGGGFFCSGAGTVSGGGIEVASSATGNVNLSSVSFINNLKTNQTLLYYGSAICVGSVVDGKANANITIDKCLFDGNSIGVGAASTSSGGSAIFIYNDQSKSVNISNCIFRNNTMENTSASGSGATCHFRDGTIRVSKTLFENNSIAVGGTVNTILSAYEAHVSLDTCYFTGNSASTANDASVQFTGSTITATNCTFASAATNLYQTSGSFSITNCGDPSRTGSYTGNTTDPIAFTSPQLASYVGDCSVGYSTSQPVEVTATSGNTGPSYYDNLRIAFSTINGGIHQGAISIKILGDITDNNTAIINASGTGSASYTSITVNPEGGNWTLTGAIAAGSPLIDLNGADNVTIDGLNTGGNSLTITNTTSSSTSGTSTIRFISGATNNTITKCTILGAVIGNVTFNTGVVLFSTDASGSGNDDNIISYNNISRTGTSLTKCIYSVGTAAKENSGNQILNNNIYDYFGLGVTNAGIYIGSNSTDWIVQNNKFYQTSSKVQTTGVQHSAIWVNNTSGNNFTISGNTIGYSASDETGTYTFGGVASSNFIPIYLNIGTTTPSSIFSNTISNITCSLVTPSNTLTFDGISLIAGTATIANNTISNIINPSTSNSAFIQGINVTGTGTVSGNLIHDLSIAGGTGSILPFSVVGICINNNTANHTVSQNTIFNLSNSNTGSSSYYVIGIYFSGFTGTNTIERNFIYSLSNSAGVGSYVKGIDIKEGNVTIKNNIVSLGYSGKSVIYGIQLPTSGSFNLNVLFNTVNIYGSSTSGYSDAMYSGTCATSTLVIRNNIFSNLRTGGSVNHSCIRFGYNVTGCPAITLNNNDYFADAGINGIVISDGSGTYRTLALWRTHLGVSTIDNASFNISPAFTNSTGTNAIDYYATASLNGVSGTGVTTDFYNASRGTPPHMGAFESNSISSLPVEVWGPTWQASYSTLKGAFDAINAGTHIGDLTVKINSSITDNNQAALNASGSGSANYTSITIYPTTTGITLSGTRTSALIYFNGADNVTIDGRANGTGSSKDLTITNTNTGANATAVFYRNSAENNTLKYCILKTAGAAITPSGVSGYGVVCFGSSTSGNGNDNNTIDNCAITSGASRCYTGVSSYGSLSYENSDLTISNNEFYNIFSNSGNSNMIQLNWYTTSATITGNSFYETTTLAPVGAYTYNIIEQLNNTSCTSAITDNFIGSSAALCASGTFTSSCTNNPTFSALKISSGSTSFQGNTISKISWTTNCTTAVYIKLISVTGAGNFDIGNISGNNFGATTGTGSLTFTNTENTAGSSSYLYVIYSDATGVQNIQNNNIGSVTTLGSSNKGYTLYGIYLSQSTASLSVNISNNLIGSLTTGNSFNASTATTGANVQEVIGILSRVNTTVTIDNNTIANLNNAKTSSVGFTMGIRVGNNDASVIGSHIISNNTVRNIISASSTTTTKQDATLQGILYYNTTATTSGTITGNTVHSLSNTYSGANQVQVNGICIKGNSAMPHTVSGNFVYGLTNSSTSNSAQISAIVAASNGVSADAGPTTFYNNIIYIGSEITTSTLKIYGIQNFTASGITNNYYFNTVYITGSPSSGSTNSAAFEIENSYPVLLKDNLFVNTRSNSGSASGAHYAIYNPSYLPVLTGSDYNNYYATGTGALLGYYNGTSCTTIANWRTATSVDASGVNTNPNITISTGTNPLEFSPGTQSAGVTIGGISTDYFGITRTVPNMGAIETAASSLVVEVYTSATLRASYATLKEAFDEINAGTANHTGDITIKITGNTTETATASLNANGSGSASYSSIIIYPTATGKSVSGAIDGPLVNLNSASNITFDGRVNATGSTTDFTISNTSTGTSASTVMFTESTSLCTVKYCFIKTASTYTNGGGAIYLYSTSVNGNDNITIDNCNITNSGTRPINLVYSSATTSANDSLIISNCNLYDNYRASTNGYAIRLQNNTTARISGNSFYETSTLTPSTSSTNFCFISSELTAGKGVIIKNNYFGGNAASCSGNFTCNMSGSYNLDIRGINISGGNATIDNNIIKGFSTSTTGGYNYFYGVKVAGSGTINIGTNTGNTIGAATGTGSISLSSSFLVSSYFHGIYTEGTGTENYQNNNIGSITTTGTASSGFHIYGINLKGASGTKTVSNNVIGGTTSNSINASGLGAPGAGGTDDLDQKVVGICSNGRNTSIISSNTIKNINNAYNGQGVMYEGGLIGIYTSANSGSNTISNNTIYNLSTASQNPNRVTASLFLPLAGIAQRCITSSYTHTVSGNTIYNLSKTSANSYYSFSFGIWMSGSTAENHTVKNNLIYGMTEASPLSTSIVYGILSSKGKVVYSNNIVTIGSGISKSSIYGIAVWEGSTTIASSWYHNTVYVGGTATSGAGTSTALYINDDHLKIIKNNIFSNMRTNSGATGTHYAMSINTISHLTIDYNDYYSSGTGAVLGTVNYTDRADIAEIRTGTTQDASSINTNPVYTNAGGTTAVDYTPNVSLTGVTGTGITLDYFASSRAATPTMGAIEATVLSDFYWVGGTGNWSNYATHWATTSGGSTFQSAAPTSSDDVYFDANSGGGIVTFDATASADIFTLTNFTGYFAGSSSLSTSSISVTAGTFDIRTTTVNVSGNATISGTASISTGTLNVDGTFDATGGNITFTSTGSLLLGGATINSLGTLTTTAGTVNYNRAGDQTILADNYFNLTIDGSGTKTLGGAINVDGALTISAASLDISGANYAIICAGNFVNNGGFTEQSGTVTFDGTSTLSGSTPTQFYNVVISGTLTGHATGFSISHNWTNTTGTFTHNNGSVTFNGTSTITTGGNTSTKKFYNLILNGTPATTTTLVGDIDIDNDFTLTAGTWSTSGSNYSMNIGGDFIRKGGTFTANSSTVTFDGTTQKINVTTSGGTTPYDANLSFYNIIVNGNDVTFYYNKTNSRVVNMNNLTINTSKQATFVGN